MTNYLVDIFYDTVSGIITQKYGSAFTDSQRREKILAFIDELRVGNVFTIEQTQAIIDKKGFNNFYTDSVNGVSCFRLVKEGFFGKAKVCYFITRTKDKMDSNYLEQVYEELRKQAAGENVFNSDRYIE
ncbi:MAG: hypothetical protein J5582_07095 [Ruminococcus sp.]|uniref:hypothetical protein n=1 Tax=Ruminococcus sp. TaxID=41978 RepID=UPI0025F180D2|nr:hypothetical protein [Ruminococcus sp.]MBO4866324.1 hypothetical protein [Ruminococcus sp.]